MEGTLAMEVLELEDNPEDDPGEGDGGDDEGGEGWEEHEEEGGFDDDPAVDPDEPAVPCGSGDNPGAPNVGVTRINAGRRHGCPARRHFVHELSFYFGPFFIKYRDDDSVLYPDRPPSWNVACPYHTNCSKSINDNQHKALERLLQWCLDADKYPNRTAPLSLPVKLKFGLSVCRMSLLRGHRDSW